MTRLPIALLLLAGTAFAQADIYKCVDEDGHVTYSNVNVRGCKRMQLDPVSTVPPVKPKAAAPAAGNPSPTGFPRVTEDTQKARDNDRRRILEQELAAEQKNLEMARKDLSDQEALRTGDDRSSQKNLDRLQPYKDRVAQHERNIQAINKELANVK